MNPEPPSPDPEGPHRRVPRALGRRGLLLWSVLVVLAVAVLSRPDAWGPLGEPSPPTDLPNPSRQSTSSPADAGHWLRLVHLSVFPAYPWVLLAPYVFWLTSRYPLRENPHGRGTRVGIWLGGGLAWVLATTTFHRLTDRVRPDVVVFAVVESREEVSPSPSSASGPGLTNHGHSTTWMAVHRTPAEPPPKSVADVLSNLLSRAAATAGPEPRGSTNAEEASRKPILIREAAPPRMVVLEHNDLPDRPPPTGQLAQLALDLERRHEAVRLPLGRLGGGMATLLLDLFAFGSLAGIAHAWHYRRQIHDRERQAFALESSLARARLHALQAQLQPHFLFNTLNSVTAMLRQNPRTAEEMLVSLSDLLRLVLSQSTRQACTVREDLRFVELYVEIQRYRFGDLLAFETEIEPAVGDLQVPTLLLQPLVENAIRHGLEPAGRRVTIRIAGRARFADRLDLIVEDDGVGCAAVAQGNQPTGVGLANVRSRLAAFFGDEATLELSSPATGSGFRVRLDLPARLAEPGSGPAGGDQGSSCPGA